MSTRARVDVGHEALAQASASVRWWPAAIALLLVSAAYALIAETLRVGPPWVLPVVAVAALLATRALRSRGMHHAGRWTAIAALVAVTAAIAASVAALLVGLLRHTTEAPDLLTGGAALWASNIVVFGLWYWEVDAGGPAHRHATHCGSSDFAFPQMILDDAQRPSDWMPEYLDYLFLAFNTSTAFSPTDTMVLARRAKVLMMCQSIISLVSVVVLVARAINAL